MEMWEGEAPTSGTYVTRKAPEFKPGPHPVPKALQEFVDRCLEIKPADRLSAKNCATLEFFTNPDLTCLNKITEAFIIMREFRTEVKRTFPSRAPEPKAAATAAPVSVADISTIITKANGVAPERETVLWGTQDYKLPKPSDAGRSAAPSAPALSATDSTVAWTVPDSSTVYHTAPSSTVNYHTAQSSVQYHSARSDNSNSTPPMGNMAIAPKVTPTSSVRSLEGVSPVLKDELFRLRAEVSDLNAQLARLDNNNVNVEKPVFYPDLR